MNIKLRLWPVLYAVILFQQVSLALSPHLYSPRVGDRIVVKQLICKPEFIDTLNLRPNLVNSQIDKELIMQLWEPAPADTVAAIVISKGRIVLELSGAEGNYSVSGVSKPGFNTHYNPLLPYGVCDSLRHYLSFTSSGNIAAFGNFKSSGSFCSQVIDNLSIVTTDGDTLRNIECLSNFISEKIDAGGGEKYKHHSRERRWYCTGYRYPLVAEFYDVIISQEGDTIDSNNIWQIIEPQSMAELKNDPLNEYLRSVKREEKHYTVDKDESLPNHRKDVALGDFIISRSGESLLVSLHTGFIRNNHIRSLLLCDLQGRVFQDLTVSEQNQSATLQMTGMPPGVYLLYIKADSSSAIYRFKI